MKFRTLSLTLLLAGLTFVVPALSDTEFLVKSVFDVPEANQGVGVDSHHFYAVDNATIAKYTKGGRLVAKWDGAQEKSPISHLDSAAVVDGKIYCAHSNYRVFPMTSSIEVWDARTMKHIGSHSIGILLGSLTWIDQFKGSWFGAFANYDRTGRLPNGSNVNLPYASVPELGKISSTIVRFNADWQVVESWIFPVELLDKFGEMSNSGGSFGPDGNLYITGHDNTEVYKIRFPEAGSILEVEETIPVTARGQGVAWDPTAPGKFYGIIRATDDESEQGISNKVVVYQTNVKPQKPRDWVNDLYHFKP
jgi:hypothetical protein